MHHYHYHYYWSSSLSSRGAEMRNVLTTLLEVSGFGLLTLAGFEVHNALGFGIGGVSLLVIGYLAGRG